MEIDFTFMPIPISPVTSDILSLDLSLEEVVCISGKLDKNKIKDTELNSQVLKVWRDVKVEPFSKIDTTIIEETRSCPIPPCDCSKVIPKGTISDVAKYLGADFIWSEGFKGDGIVVGIIDWGITAEGRITDSKDWNHPEWSGKLVKNVIGGSRPNWGTTGLIGKSWHGNMCATDVLGIAPNAKLYDISIAPGSGVDLLKAYQWAIGQHRIDGTPQIIVDSGGIFQKKDNPDAAINPNHFLVRKLLEAIDEGIIVFHAAGNCGSKCHSPLCGTDFGSGKSIWGRAGHEKVITVVAVNVREEYCAWSSVGPAALSERKPDFAAISNFTGYTNCDTGTSAASPIAAGVLALLKQVRPSEKQRTLKQVLMDSAKNIGPPGWDIYTGAGIIQGSKAYKLLLSLPIRKKPNSLPIDRLLKKKLGGEGAIVIFDPRSDLVKDLQKILIYLDYDLGDSGPNGNGVSGTFENKTLKAVRKFQTNHVDKDNNQLGVDGEVGQLTGGSLNSVVKNY